MKNIHPLFVHFPIALLLFGLLFDLAYSAIKRESLAGAGWWCHLSGVAAAGAAIFTGLLAEDTVTTTGAVHEMMETHETLQLIAAGAFALLLVWRILKRGKISESPSYRTAYFAIAIVAVGALLYGAHLGGRMVFESGVGGSAAARPAQIPGTGR